jgi:anti-sigma-K factor RskA
MSLVQSTPQAEAATPIVTQSTRPALTALPSLPADQAAQGPPTTQDGQGNVTDLGAYRARRNTTAVVQALLGVAAVLILLLGLWAWTANSDKNKIEGQPNIPAGYSLLILPPQKGYESVSAVAFYNPQKNDVVFVGKGLATPPSGKVYELWFLKGQGNPDPAGTFLPDQTGNAEHTGFGPQTASQYAGFAVSVEPTPGSAAPTGPIIVAGTYSTP